MKKSELVTLVAEKTGFSKKDTEKTIADALRSGRTDNQDRHTVCQTAFPCPLQARPRIQIPDSDLPRVRGAHLQDLSWKRPCRFWPFRQTVPQVLQDRKRDADHLRRFQGYSLAELCIFLHLHFLFPALCIFLHLRFLFPALFSLVPVLSPALGTFLSQPAALPSASRVLSFPLHIRPENFPCIRLPPRQ